MDWQWVGVQFLVHLVPALPWLIAGLGGLSIFTFSPLGRALAHRLRHGAEDPERSARLLEEVSAMRGELGEVLERLDYAERLLTRGLSGERPALPDISGGTDQVATPT